MTTPRYGMVFNTTDNDPRPAQPSDLSVIGLVLPSDDAVAATFPLNEPIAFDSGDIRVLPALGTGDLYKVVNTIDNQLADLQRSARIVAVRVSKGATIDETIANIVGDRAKGTGLYALLKARTVLGVVPRMVGAPGYTGHGNIAVDDVIITNGGEEYTHADVVFDPPGAAGEAIIKDGMITGVNMTAPGDYPQGTVLKVTFDGDGNGAAANVTTQLLANPICAALPEVLNVLLAHAVVGSPGSSQLDALMWRQTLSDPRLIPVDNWQIIQMPGVADDEYQDGAAAVLGLAARVDFKHGGLPFWSFSGQPIQGILGLKHNYTFSLVDGATQGQELLAQNIGVTERGELGDETAISASGFVFAGLWNASTDPLQWFYNKRRGRDWTHLALMKSIRLRLGTENVTPQGVQDVINDMNAIGSYLISKKAVLGFKVSFNGNDNSPNELRQGNFAISYNQEEPAPIAQVTINSGPYYEALTYELGTLIAQAAQLPAQYLGAANVII